MLCICVNDRGYCADDEILERIYELRTYIPRKWRRVCDLRQNQDDCMDMYCMIWRLDMWEKVILLLCM